MAVMTNDLRPKRSLSYFGSSGSFGSFGSLGSSSLLGLLVFWVIRVLGVLWAFWVLGVFVLGVLWSLIVNEWSNELLGLGLWSNDESYGFSGSFWSLGSSGSLVSSSNFSQCDEK